MNEIVSALLLGYSLPDGFPQSVCLLPSGEFGLVYAGYVPKDQYTIPVEEVST